jgi:arylsulfotransferase ASST
LDTRYTRSKFLKTVGAGAGWIALTSALGCEPKQRRSDPPPPAQAKHSVWNFRSRPELIPPAVEVTTPAHDTAPGYVFVAPKRGVLAPKRGPGQNGPMILEDNGQVVWFYSMQERGKSAADFKVQSYQDRPVLTWWEGRLVHGVRSGEWVILDDSYREIARVRPSNGYGADMHELLITPEDTALLAIYNKVAMDLSSVGGPKDGSAVEGVVQEVDIETGNVHFEWHSLDHVTLEESHYKPAPKGWSHKNFDYFHLNSIDIDHDGNLLISAKKTSTVYKLDRKTGDVVWRLGGINSDFKMGPGTRFRRQHDARRQRDGTITIFDNGVPKDERSRGIAVDLDMDAMNAALVREFTHPKKLVAVHEANMQVLPNGNAFIGWGSEPVISEFSSEGELLFDANFINKQQTYRAFRFPWTGQPQDDPAVVAERGPKDRITLYVSWNGATEVATWQVLAGSNPHRLKPVGSAPRRGFETKVSVRTAEPYVAVHAKSASGRVLGTTRAVKPGDRTASSDFSAPVSS